VTKKALKTPNKINRNCVSNIPYRAYAKLRNSATKNEFIE